MKRIVLYFIYYPEGNFTLVKATRINTKTQGFFSKFLMGGGTQNFRSPLVPDGDEVGWGGGLAKKIRLKPKLPTKCKIRAFFAILSLKYSILMYF